MKVLITTRLFMPVGGGIERYSHELARSLTNAGVDVGVLTAPARGGREFDAKQEYRVVRVPGMQLKWIKLLPLFFYTLLHTLRFRPSVTISMIWAPAGIVNAFLSLLPFGNFRFWLVVHGSEVTWYKHILPLRLLMRFVFSRAEVIIPNSNATSEVIADLIAEDKPRFVLYPAVDSKVFRPIEDKAALRKKHGIPQDANVILTIGRLDNRRKGHDNVIKAVAQLKSKFPQLLYLVGGKGAEGDRLEALAKSLGVSARVRFLGFVEEEDLVDLYNLSDIFITASRVEKVGEKGKDYEGFGIVYLEASACGIPVVAGREGGASEAVIDEGTGLLVDAYDIDDIAENIERLLLDQELSQRLGSNGRKRVEKELNWTAQAFNLLSEMKARGIDR